MSNPSIDDFAPRVGFAWQPLATNRLVVRGGFGYFYDRTDFGSNQGPAIEGEPYATMISASGAANYFSTFALPYGHPVLGWTPRWINLAAGTSSNVTAIVLQPNIPTPLTNQWNLNTQYEFLPGWVLELGYVGSHGIHQIAGIRRSTRLNWRARAIPSMGSPLIPLLTPLFEFPTWVLHRGCEYRRIHGRL